MKNYILIIAFCFTTISTSFAQEVVASAGETQQAGSIELSWTLGESVIETFTSGAILTQGFHQSKLLVTAIDEPSLLVSELKVYPNPASEFVMIHFNSEIKDKQYSLFDMTGKMLLLNSISETDSRIDVSSLASGTYLLRISAKKTNNIQSFKIVKK
ncbi:T9SS type A sorting domain-containing protein [Maribellus comscasis]|uniref:T9SS type A sorting domain-containing protein n=1 Tax=Maribellus comscasis TaxID=2681766 RepID=A0A6I6JU25_9BACT|nr:T9SS type A sorting domain-containing protein [Maribellus comscasis]QGY46526.1 T9SS type A sorting domain-containing protein [Maribellus comscasis]